MVLGYEGLAKLNLRRQAIFISCGIAITTYDCHETECHHNVILDEQNQMAIMTCSNISEIVSQCPNKVMRFS